MNIQDVSFVRLYGRLQSGNGRWLAELIDYNVRVIRTERSSPADRLGSPAILSPLRHLPAPATRAGMLIFFLATCTASSDQRHNAKIDLAIMWYYAALLPHHAVDLDQTLWPQFNVMQQMLFLLSGSNGSSVEWDQTFRRGNLAHRKVFVHVTPTYYHWLLLCPGRM